MQGYIKDFRQELESDVWKMSPLYHRTWQYLKYQANHAENIIPMANGTMFHIKPGQHMTSIRNIAKGIGWYEGTIWRQPNIKTVIKILKWFSNKKMISTEIGYRQYTLVTLTNWALYQGKTASRYTDDGTEGIQIVVTNKNEETEKTDPRNNKNNNAPFSDGKAGATVQDRKARNNITVLHEIEYYKTAYERARGMEHPHLKLDQYIRAYDAIEERCVDEEGWEAMLYFHFHDSALETDYNIMHFITGEIMDHAFFKAGLYC
jgi:hypothetical protein